MDHFLQGFPMTKRDNLLLFPLSYESKVKCIHTPINFLRVFRITDGDSFLAYRSLRWNNISVQFQEVLLLLPVSFSFHIFHEAGSEYIMEAKGELCICGMHHIKIKIIVYSHKRMYSCNIRIHICLIYNYLCNTKLIKWL